MSNRPHTMSEGLKIVAKEINDNYTGETHFPRPRKLLKYGRLINWEKSCKKSRNHPFLYFSKRIKEMYLNALNRYIQNESKQILSSLKYKDQQREKSVNEYIMKIVKEKECIQPRDLKNVRIKYNLPKRQGWYHEKILFLLSLKYDNKKFFIRYPQQKAFTHAIYVNPELLLYFQFKNMDEEDY